MPYYTTVDGWIDTGRVQQLGTTLNFGTVTIEIFVEQPIKHLEAGVIVPANLQGVMAAGLARDIRIAAGAQIERDLRAQLPLIPGEAYLTGPAALQERGVEVVAHAVVVRDPGSTARGHDLEDALISAMQRLEVANVRAILIPFLTTRLAGHTTEVNAHLLAKLVVQHLRRASRIKRVTLAGIHSGFAAALAGSLRELGATRGE